MKVYILFISLLALFSLNVGAAASFTNITSLEDKYVFAAVKVVEDEMEMVSHLIEVKTDGMKSQKIKLPNELAGREVVGLFPTEKEALLVVTQITRGGGDKPLVYQFDIAKRSWKKVSEVDCVSFAKVKVEKNQLIFSCEQTSDAGVVKIVPKAVKVDSTLTQLGEVTLPVTKIDSKGLKATLEGEDFSWDKFKVSKGKTEKSFSP